MGVMGHSLEKSVSRKLSFVTLFKNKYAINDVWGASSPVKTFVAFLKKSMGDSP
jgi:hypothetical protein